MKLEATHLRGNLWVVSPPVDGAVHQSTFRRRGGKKGEAGMKVNIEITDTFGGEANYTWVRRYTLDLPDMCTNDYVVRQVKRHIGWTGQRCVREEYHDQVVLRPRGECVVCFINFI